KDSGAARFGPGGPAGGKVAKRRKRDVPRTRSAGSGSAPETESVGGYFRALFEANPALREPANNAELLQRWLADHPESSVIEAVKKSLANVKRILRESRKSAERDERSG